jgi:hypothetical protein
MGLEEKKMKKIFLLTVIVLLGYFAGSPYLTLMNLKSDIESRNGESLAEKVDFSSVRESLKAQFNVVMAKATMDSSNEDDPWGAAGAALGAAFASTLVNGMVDGLVTPSGLIELMSSGEIDPSDTANQPQTGSQQDLAISDAALSYEGMNKFSATLVNDDGDEMKLILKRRGLSWVVTDIRLPLDDFGT